VDVAHEIEPQNRLGAAYVLTQALPYFPAGSVHLAVVDPGVGTKRRPIAVEGAGHRFVGPDNGTLSWVLSDLGIIDPDSGKLIDGRAVELTNPTYRRPEVSATFHGRDIFAPAAAHLAAGVTLDALGPSIGSVEVLTGRRPDVSSRGVAGVIIHVDTFGNAISNISVRDLPESPTFEVAGLTLVGLARTYQDAEFAAIVGSEGLVEIAARNGSASARFGIHNGDPVFVRGSA
jgi:S-adenosylmethionine hydrolase